MSSSSHGHVASTSVSSTTTRDKRPSFLTQAHFEHIRSLRRQQQTGPPLSMLNKYEDFIAPTDCRCPSCRMQTKYGPHVLCQNGPKKLSGDHEATLATLPETAYSPKLESGEKRKLPAGEVAGRVASGIKRRLSASKERQAGSADLRESTQQLGRPEVTYSSPEVSSGVFAGFDSCSVPHKGESLAYAELVFHARALLSDFDVPSTIAREESPRDSVVGTVRDSDVENDLAADLEETTRKLREIELAYGGEEDEEEYPLHFRHDSLSRRYF